jgi:ArsR family transcriptional regulator
MAENCEHVASVMKALGHPQRLMIMCHLSQSEKTVGELEELCEISQSAVSQFLNRMKLEGLVASEKRGLYVYYWIQDERIKELITALHRVFCR